MAKKSRILLLSRDPRLEESVKTALEGDRYHIVDVREAGVLQPLLTRGVSLVAVDLDMPDPILEETAARLGEFQEVPTLLLNRDSLDLWHRFSRDTPLEEQLDLPFTAEELPRRVDQLLEKARFLQGAELIGRSPVMQELRERILLVAPTPVSTILITGESGAGKDVVAQALHHYSERRDKPFKPINCAAIPENLLESELFGHEKGAFTDARAQHKGIFEQANGGTVFLDEIGEMSQMAQLRLLRVLDQREVTRVGGSAAVPIDIRVISATNKDLQEAVAHRQFRLDLYHRLKVVELAIPPLRQRTEDIPLLVDYFVAQLTGETQGRFEGFSTAAMDLLLDYDWPGNVRELRNLLERQVFLGPRRPLNPQDLLPHLERPPLLERHLPVATGKTPDQSERELIYFALLDLKREVAELRRMLEEQLLRPSQPTPVYPLEEPLIDAGPQERVESPIEPLPTLKDLEKEAIETALRRVGGNRKKAAEILAISPRTLYRKLDDYDLK